MELEVKLSVLRSTLLWACLLALPFGCVQTVYSPGQTPLPGSVSPPSQWSATGDLRSIAKAIDGNVGTAATASSSTRNGASITIDLGKTCIFNFVAIEHGPNPLGYARQVAVLTSSDGTTFTRRYYGPGKRKVTGLLLTKPVMARYVKLQADVPGARPWSVAEVYFQ